jgi:hypothetical protein
MRPNRGMFTQIQQAELRELASSIVELRNWDLLPWADAWNGTYSLKPTSAQIELEFGRLSKKASRIMGGGSLEFEYSNVEERLRMASLELAMTFELYNSHEAS